jgi:hypothetical protein
MGLLLVSKLLHVCCNVSFAVCSSSKHCCAFRMAPPICSAVRQVSILNSGTMSAAASKICPAIVITCKSMTVPPIWVAGRIGAKYFARKPLPTLAPPHSTGQHEPRLRGRLLGLEPGGGWVRPGTETKARFLRARLTNSTRLQSPAPRGRRLRRCRLGKAEFFEPSPKSTQTPFHCIGRSALEANNRRARSERPSNRTAEQREELPPLYSITSSHERAAMLALRCQAPSQSCH